MLIKTTALPNSNIARHVFLVEFCNTIGGKADMARTLLAFAVQAEQGSTGEITFGSLRSACGSSSSRALDGIASHRPVC